MNRSTTASWVKVMAGAAALSLTLAACGGSDDSQSNGSDEEKSSSDESSAPADSFTNDTCKGGQTSQDAYKAGAILPLTGTLASLGPPEIAGVGLAVSDVNAAGGVGGNDACHQILDSGDTTDLSVSTASAAKLVAAKPSIVVGAASSSVSLNFVDTLNDYNIVQISPANTAVDLSGYAPFYFRTAPPDGIQGNALGTLITSDGFQKVGFLVFQDTYGVGLRNEVQATIEASGGECVYGCQGDGDEFQPGQTTYSTDVTGVVNASPDAIVIVAFDETKQIVPELASSGFDMSKVYFTDGNLNDYSEDFDPGTLEGAKGTLPGADLDATFKSWLNGWSESAQGTTLKTYSYGAESYDAVMLGALAAVKGGDTKPTTIQKNLAAVSGDTDGEECTTYEDCVALLDEGKEIRYAGPSGIGPIDAENDPSSAFIGIYQFLDDNTYELLSTVEGSKQ